MRRILPIIVIILALGGILMACEQEPLTPEEKENLAKMAGTWQVINVNCPNVLAEKVIERKTFRADTNSMGDCIDNIQPGWTVEVDKDGTYAFFPPPKPSKAPGNKPQ